MRVLRLACVTGMLMALGASSAPASGSYVLTATRPEAGHRYAPTFTGNGLLGVRVPATGQGFAGGSVPAQSELAGFYAKPTKPKSAGDAVQQRANIPTWSTLTFADGGQPFSLRARNQGPCDQGGDALERHGRAHRGRRQPGADDRSADQLPGHRGPELHLHQVRGDRQLRGHDDTGGGGPVRGRGRGRGDYRAARIANATAWAALWDGRIDVLGNPTVATDVNASEFYLWSNTRDGVDWSISPAGLSSNGYDGHIFWDAETWMYPSLLAQHPDLGAGMDAYRFARLAQAQQHAATTGFTGAQFPWESAFDGTEQTPPPVSVNSGGVFEQHITADVGLAQSVTETINNKKQTVTQMPMLEELTATP